MASGLVIYSSDPDWVTARAVQRSNLLSLFWTLLRRGASLLAPSALGTPAARPIPLFHMPLAGIMTLVTAIVVIEVLLHDPSLKRSGKTYSTA